MRIEYAAPEPVRDAIEALGRTEDLRLSPDHRRLAIAGFRRNRIAILEIELGESATGTSVTINGALELSSPALKRPHGLDFIDDHTLIVANRGGDVTVFDLPAAEPGHRSREVTPRQTWSAGGLNLVESPGSVALASGVGDRCEVLVCNNHIHTVTRHRFDADSSEAAVESDVLLRKWLKIPDGVAVSHDRRWIAISNHSTHSVLVYDYSSALDEDANPVAVLRDLRYPHGLRFSQDDRRLFVADAGAPHVQIYDRDGDQWSGVRDPAATITVVDDAVFARGHVNPQEGGPKGIDISPDSNLLVTTTEFQPLAFFDISAVMAQADESAVVATDRGGPASEVATQLSLMDFRARAEIAEAALDGLTTSISWRITAPLRRLRSMLSRRR